MQGPGHRAGRATVTLRQTRHLRDSEQREEGARFTGRAHWRHPAERREERGGRGERLAAAAERGGIVYQIQKKKAVFKITMSVSSGTQIDNFYSKLFFRSIIDLNV